MPEYVWPCPTVNSVSSNYGYRGAPVPGASTFHAGIDIPTPMGSSVVSIADGEVLEINNFNENGLRGQYVRILHDSGIVSHYQHLQQSVDGLQVGHRVVQSEKIAISGKSGIGTGPHTDFRLYKKISLVGKDSSTTDSGATFNPLDYVTPALSNTIYPPGTGEANKGLKLVEWIPG